MKKHLTNESYEISKIANIFFQSHCSIIKHYSSQMQVIKSLKALSIYKGLLLLRPSAMSIINLAYWVASWFLSLISLLLIFKLALAHRFI